MSGPAPGSMGSLTGTALPVRRIVTVCTANLCRSPLVAAALAAAFARRGVQVEVSSAGVRALDGLRPPPDWVEVVAECGFDLDGHRSAGLAGRTEGVGLLVAMTADHARAMASNSLDLLGRIGLLEPLALDPLSVLDTVGAQRAFDLLRLDDRFDIPDPVRAPIRAQREIARRLIDLSEQVAERWPR